MTAPQNAHGALLELTAVLCAARVKLTRQLRDAVGLDLQHAATAFRCIERSRKSLALASQLLDLLTSSCQGRAKLALERRKRLLRCGVARSLLPHQSVTF